MMDAFQQSCQAAYRFVQAHGRTTSEDVRNNCHCKFHEWRDILFHLRINYGVISVRGKGIFIDDATYQRWLTQHRRLAR
ncbi:hypothetical protein [Entomohabitans teleogrylli]|uniref:hypothetical protein n=1 Tax=Entomohabitans teleogrylli TaxID=1384589 RepID=UPI000AEA49A8|nr:hypothetical protein [Entomohabitans teleogrylli]